MRTTAVGIEYVWEPDGYAIHALRFDAPVQDVVVQLQYASHQHTGSARVWVEETTGGTQAIEQFDFASTPSESYFVDLRVEPRAGDVVVVAHAGSPRVLIGGEAYVAEASSTPVNPIETTTSPLEQLNHVSAEDAQQLEAAGYSIASIALPDTAPLALLAVLNWQGHGKKVVEMMTHARQIEETASAWNTRDRDPQPSDTPAYGGEFWFNASNQSYHWHETSSGIWHEVA